MTHASVPLAPLQQLIGSPGFYEVVAGDVLGFSSAQPLKNMPTIQT